MKGGRAVLAVAVRCKSASMIAFVRSSCANRFITAAGSGACTKVANVPPLTAVPAHTSQSRLWPRCCQSHWLPSDTQHHADENNRGEFRTHGLLPALCQISSLTETTPHDHERPRQRYASAQATLRSTP